MFGKRKSKNPQPALSVVVPVHNEEENIERLHQRLLSVLRKIEGETEILYVDDGSTDRTPGLLAECVAAVRNTETEINVSVIVLRRNYGQSAALAAGFDHARGRVVVTLDADLQNPPEEIPRLLAKL
ncbi:MAG: glycosyltransferase, partial [Candidatus Hydrogenedentota bacterium]